MIIMTGHVVFWGALSWLFISTVIFDRRSPFLQAIVVLLIQLWVFSLDILIKKKKPDDRR